MGVFSGYDAAIDGKFDGGEAVDHSNSSGASTTSDNLKLDVEKSLVG